jgi:DNA-binding MarR family transcriptional regulator
MLREQSEEPVGLLLAAIRRRLRQLVHAEARCHRLSPQQFWAVVAVQEAGPASLGALAERLKIDAPTASRVFATLTRRRLVRMAEDPADRRRLLLAPTAEGAELAQKLRPVARELRESLTAGFTPAELGLLRGALRRVLDNLDRFDARRARRPARPADPREERP